MSSALRAPSVLWTATSVDTTSAAKASSKAANVGVMSNVAIFLNVSGACTIKIQAAAPNAPSVGRNSIPLTDGTQESSWYDLHEGAGLESAGANSPGLKVTFTGAGSACIDLSPFAPPFLRLVRTDGGAAVTITAWVTALG